MSKAILIPVFLAAFLIAGCSKVNDDDTNAFRLKSWNDTANRHAVKIEYKNHKVSEVSVYYADDRYTRNIWTYDDKTITIREYNYYLYQGWVEEPDYRVLSFNDQNRLARCDYVNDNLVLNENYYWDDDRLIRQEKYLKDGRIFTTTFTYENNLLVSTTGNNFLDYSDGEIQSLSYINNSDTIYHTEFVHVGGLLTEVIRGTEWVQLLYDGNKNIKKRIYNLDQPYFSYSSATFLEYEKGSGNLDLYWLIEYGWVHVYLYHNMMPPFSQNEAFHFE